MRVHVYTHLQQLDAACCDLDLEVVQAQAHGGPPPAPQVRGLTQGAVATAGHVAQDAVKGTRVPAYHTPHARHIKSNMIVEAGKARPLHASNRQGSHHWRTFCQVSDNAAIPRTTGHVYPVHPVPAVRDVHCVLRGCASRCQSLVRGEGLRLVTRHCNNTRHMFSDPRGKTPLSRTECVTNDTDAALMSRAQA